MWENAKHLLCVTIELPALVHTEDEVDLLACTVGLIQDALVVALGSPETFFHTQVQVKLGGTSV